MTATIIAVLNRKGEVAKATTDETLAYYLHCILNKRVLLVDADASRPRLRLEGVRPCGLIVGPRVSGDLWQLMDPWAAPKAPTHCSHRPDYEQLESKPLNCPRKRVNSRCGLATPFIHLTPWFHGLSVFYYYLITRNSVEPIDVSSKNISVSLPIEMIREVDQACRTEHRNRSELIREALRRYLAVSQAPLHEWQKDLLRERIHAHQADPKAVEEWTRVRSELWPELA